MSRIDVFGAGAFGTAMALVLDRAGHDVALFLRQGADAVSTSRRAPRLPEFEIPHKIRVTGDRRDCTAPVALVCVPTQQIEGFVAETPLKAEIAVSCAKGIDLATGLGPARLLARYVPISAQLTGPSFAEDIARGLPTALTLACVEASASRNVQSLFEGTPLRLYRSTDVIGAELGGALKNVIALACGAAVGEGMGNSARAALMTRGFAEMVRLATTLGAEERTLSGLSGMGDLALTCYSEQSRNFRRGLALGRQDAWEETTTVEGVATAHAVAKLAADLDIDMPIVTMMAGLLDGRSSIAEAITKLLNRPTKEE